MPLTIVNVNTIPTARISEIPTLQLQNETSDYLVLQEAIQPCIPLLHCMLMSNDLKSFR